MCLPCLPMCFWRKPYSYSLAFTNIWFDKTYQLISADKTLSIFSEQQLKINFSFSMVSCMNKQTVSLWDPHLVRYSLMRLCVASKKDWSRKARCPHTTGDFVDDTLAVMTNKTSVENRLETPTSVTALLCSPCRLIAMVCFPSWAPSSSTDLYMWRPKSLSSPRTLASCCITKAT